MSSYSSSRFISITALATTAILATAYFLSKEEVEEEVVEDHSFITSLLTDGEKDLFHLNTTFGSASKPWLYFGIS